jgi:FAD:protein FMN transferase
VTAPAESDRAAITAGWPAHALVRTSFTAFATFGVLIVTRQAAAPQARSILGRELRAIDLACSRFRCDSELTRLNAASGTRQAVTPLLAEALDVALRAAAATDGAVDPTCGQSLVQLGYDADFAEVLRRSSGEPASPQPAGGWDRVELDRTAMTVRIPHGVLIDLGATAKALAADRAARAIAAEAGTGVLVNLGGDIAVAGPAPRGGWRVEIDAVQADRGARGAPRPVIAIQDGGLATSGPASRVWYRGRQRLHHIVDPSTGAPADSCWSAATVAAATCVDANAASTAAIVMSAAAGDWLTRLGLPARLVSTAGAVVTTRTWPDEP